MEETLATTTKSEDESEKKISETKAGMPSKIGKI